MLKALSSTSAFVSFSVSFGILFRFRFYLKFDSCVDSSCSFSFPCSRSFRLASVIAAIVPQQLASDCAERGDVQAVGGQQADRVSVCVRVCVCVCVCGCVCMVYRCAICRVVSVAGRLMQRGESRERASALASPPSRALVLALALSVLCREP